MNELIPPLLSLEKWYLQSRAYDRDRSAVSISIWRINIIRKIEQHRDIVKWLSSPAITAGSVPPTYQETGSIAV